MRPACTAHRQGPHPGGPAGRRPALLLRPRPRILSPYLTSRRNREDRPEHREERSMAYLEGKAVVVTGAGRGLGRAYAHLASREGASIVVNDIDADVAEAVTAEIVNGGGKAVTAVADVGDWAGAESIIDRCLAEFGA